MNTALSYAMQLLLILPDLIAAGKNVGALVTSGNAALRAMADEKRNPTATEWDELNGHITKLRTELHSA